MTMPASNNTAARRYLDLLRHALCRDRFPDARYDMSSGSLKLMPFDPALRAQGRDWPLEAVTMVGTKRLENLENCCCTLWRRGFLETSSKPASGEVAVEFSCAGSWRQPAMKPAKFRDTIPKAKVDSISVLRLDGDLYESTWLVLDHLYPKVSPGGFVIIDDYALPTCKAAVDDFRAKHSIHSLVTTIDWSGIFWRK